MRLLLDAVVRALLIDRLRIDRLGSRRALGHGRGPRVVVLPLVHAVRERDGNRHTHDVVRRVAGDAVVHRTRHRPVGGDHLLVEARRTVEPAEQAYHGNRFGFRTGPADRAADDTLAGGGCGNGG